MSIKDKIKEYIKRERLKGKYNELEKEVEREKEIEKVCKETINKQRLKVAGLQHDLRKLRED